MTDHDWLSTDAVPPLCPEVVDLWRFTLQRPSEQIAALAPLLCDDERQRAERFTFPGLRERYIAGRGVMRTILGRYLQVPPHAVRFTYNKYGKPLLGDGQTIKFNLSHSGDWALLGVVSEAEIGVDIERHRQEVQCESLARHFFSPAEVAALAALAPGERRAAFFACWSRKEAYIKAVGRALAIPLDSFAVSLGPREPAALLWVKQEPEATRRWRLESIDAGADFSAAICVQQPIRQLRRYAWP